jgi:hypothetical protein
MVCSAARLGENVLRQLRFSPEERRRVRSTLGGPAGYDQLSGLRQMERSGNAVRRRHSFRLYDTKSGAMLADVTIPDVKYLNDVTVTRDAAWFTDSLGPALIRVPLAANGRIGSPQKVVLGGDGGDGRRMAKRGQSVRLPPLRGRRQLRLPRPSCQRTQRHTN